MLTLRNNEDLDKSKPISVNIKIKLVERLTSCADILGYSRSYLIECAIASVIDDLEKRVEKVQTEARAKAQRVADADLQHYREKYVGA